jgi:hypothetical protein
VELSWGELVSLAYLIRDVSTQCWHLPPRDWIKVYGRPALPRIFSALDGISPSKVTQLGDIVKRMAVSIQSRFAHRTDSSQPRHLLWGAPVQL